MGKGSSQTTQTTISPQLRQQSIDIVDALMQAGSINPWDMEYEGPRMAAMNESQKQAMDATAARGQALGLNFTSAADSLPQSSMIDGMEVYDTLGLAKQNIPPAMQELYDALYGPGGVIGQYNPKYAPQDPFANIFQPQDPNELTHVRR